MFHHYFLINLLNFPYNVEEILQELQEDADFLEQQTVGDWLRLLCTRNSWTTAELQQKLGATDAQFEKMKASKKLPSAGEKHRFKSLLT